MATKHPLTITIEALNGILKKLRYEKAKAPVGDRQAYAVRINALLSERNNLLHSRWINNKNTRR